LIFGKGGDSEGLNSFFKLLGEALGTTLTKALEIINTILEKIEQAIQATKDFFMPNKEKIQTIRAQAKRLEDDPGYKAQVEERTAELLNSGVHWQQAYNQAANEITIEMNNATFTVTEGNAQKAGEGFIQGMADQLQDMYNKDFERRGL